MAFEPSVFYFVFPLGSELTELTEHELLMTGKQQQKKTVKWDFEEGFEECKEKSEPKFQQAHHMQL